jgi:hypothetical protein
MPLIACDIGYFVSKMLVPDLVILYKVRWNFWMNVRQLKYQQLVHLNKLKKNMLERGRVELSIYASIAILAVTISNLKSIEL